MSEVSPRWTDAGTVAGFETGQPNQVLLEFAKRFAQADAAPRCLDIGCGAARNALPLAALGFRVSATDLSAPMLEGAKRRILGTRPQPLVEAGKRVEVSREFTLHRLTPVVDAPGQW